MLISYVELCQILGKSMSTIGTVIVVYLACMLLFYVLPVTSVANKEKVTVFYESAAWQPGLILNTLYTLLFVAIWVNIADTVNKNNLNEAEGLGVILAVILTFMLSVLFFIINSFYAHEYAKREKDSIASSASQQQQ